MVIILRTLHVFCDIYSKLVINSYLKADKICCLYDQYIPDDNNHNTKVELNSVNVLTVGEI